MAFIETHLKSQELGMEVVVNVVLPQKAKGLIGMQSTVRENADSADSAGSCPVLWLLHGASDDQSIWLRRTSVERYVSALGIAIVCPNAHLSSYTDMYHGGRFFSYIADELPKAIRGFFPMLSAKPEDNFIAGLSMGGYGALKIGLSRPEQYSAIGCFSSGNLQVDMEGNMNSRPGGKERREMVFGNEPVKGSQHDAYALAQQILDAKKPTPRIYHACGSEDFLLSSAHKTRDFFQNLPGNPFGYEYNETPGSHEWGFWDVEIQNFLRFLKLESVNTPVLN